MKKHKVLLIGITLLSMVGCTSQPTQKDNRDFLYFLFAAPLVEHPIWLQAKEGFDDACQEYNVKCDWLGPVSIDTQAMDQVIEKGILQEADGIITQGVVNPALIASAASHNIPVILVDSDIPDSSRHAYLGKDFVEQARLYLNDIEAKYGKEKPLNIGIQVAESSFHIAQQQIEDIEEIFANHPGGYEIAYVLESKSDQVRAKKEWSNALANQDINVAINLAGESAVACSEVATEMGLRDQMLIYGVDDIGKTVDFIAEGKIDGSVVTSFYNYGYTSVKRLYELTQHKANIENEPLRVPLLLVQKDNVKTYKDLLK